MKDSGSPSSTLRKVLLPIVSDEKCRDAYEHIKVITDDMICAGYDAGGKDSCKVRSMESGTTDQSNSMSKCVLCRKKDLTFLNQNKANF